MSRGMYATWNDLPRMYFGDVGVSLLKVVVLVSRGMHTTRNDLPRTYCGDVGVSLLKGGCWCHAACMPLGTIFLVCNLVNVGVSLLKGGCCVTRHAYHPKRSHQNADDTGIGETSSSSGTRSYTIVSFLGERERGCRVVDDVALSYTREELLDEAIVAPANTGGVAADSLAEKVCIKKV